MLPSGEACLYAPIVFMILFLDRTAAAVCKGDPLHFLSDLSLREV